MKTSIFLIAALLLNTFLLFAEPLAAIVQDINTWVFIMLETVLVSGYFLNRILKELSSDYELELGALDIFVVGTPNK